MPPPLRTPTSPGLVALLQDDVTLEMPPLSAWYAGVGAVQRFFASHVLRVPGRFRLLPVVANGQPAFASYLRDPDGAGRAHAIQVLSTAGGRFTRIVIFLDPGRFAGFGLPQVIDAATGAVEMAVHGWDSSRPDPKPGIRPERRPPSPPS
jgi:hypothetical protein